MAEKKEERHAAVVCPKCGRVGYLEKSGPVIRVEVGYGGECQLGTPTECEYWIEAQLIARSRLSPRQKQ